MEHRFVRQRTDLMILNGYSGSIQNQENIMKTAFSTIVIVVAATTVLVGCATQRKKQASIPDPSTYQSATSRFGMIDSIEALQGDRKTGSTGMVGDGAEKNRKTQGVNKYQINVLLDSGDISRVAQDNIVDLHVGDRVRVVDGRVYRY
jgi:outer membrane lipoprotein SlyB